MNVLDLFSGIGGFSLGLERAGMRTVAFCEIDPFCRKILARRFPGRPVWDDVRTLTAKSLDADAHRWRQSQQPQCNGHSLSEQQSPLRHDALRLDIDLICGGFPCQDISVAGKGAGIGGERSGLWSEYARIIGEVRPRYVIVENVAALLGRGIERVLGDLAALGFDAEWHCIPACAVGAPHRRDRVWIVAYYAAWDVRGESAPSGAERQRTGQCGEPLALADTDGEPSRWSAIPWSERNHWLSEPDVGRVAHGVPFRVDRLRALGNAIVPQIAEIIGRAIMSIERDAYDGDDDFSKSIDEAYRVIRERKANGGPGWGGWE